MYKILKKAGLFSLFGVLLLASCNKFDEINTNPDATGKVNASLLATKIILQNLKYQGRDAKSYLSDNGMDKYIAYGNETILSTQYNYLGATDFTPMTLVPNVNSMLANAAGSQMENSYKGLAKFSRAFMFYYLTMEVGDIPYSTTGLGGKGDIRPVYDAQENVFKGILDELKDADGFFAQGIKFNG
ncbi:MAG: SusD/RagB family nutrient-binding outer membrane lipoprotein, partial [Chitinophagaceae bacterium]